VLANQLLAGVPDGPTTNCVEAVTVPTALVAVITKTVVLLGDTLREPDGLTGPIP